MILAKVTGNLTAAQKIGDLDSLKLLILRPIAPDDSFTGPPLVAVDTVQAGLGDRVLVIDEGGSAGVILGMSSQPIRTVVAGVVDRIDYRRG